MNSKSEQMFSLLLLSIMVDLTSFQPLNVYYMNDDYQSEQFIYDCLHYHLEDSIIPDDVEYYVNKYRREIYLPPYHIILYCFRPLKKPKTNSLHFFDVWKKKFTFEELRTMNVSSAELYSWSAPIDLVEQYQIYTGCSKSRAGK